MSSAPGLEPLRREFDALVAMSEAVRSAGDLDATLDLVTRTAAELSDARTAALWLVPDDERERRLRLAASLGFTQRYMEEWDRRFGGWMLESAPSSRALASRQPVCVADVTTDPLYAPWASLAKDEGYVSMVSVPLIVGDRRLGVLNVFWFDSHQCSEQELQLLVAIAGHAATAIHIAQLLDTTRRQLDSQQAMVISLRAQAHEFSNRLHAIGGLLALGEHQRAEQFVGELTHSFVDSYSSVGNSIREVAVAGFLIAQLSVASESHVDFRIHKQSRLDELPAGMDAASLLTVVGNLLSNAFEAVGALPSAERRVTLRISQSAKGTRLLVRNRVDPALTEVDDLFAIDESTKPGHFGLGLKLARSEVERVAGAISARADDGWVEFDVRLPGAPGAGSRR